MMMMMAMFGIERSLFVSYCKNNSKYHIEIIHFDQSEWDEIYINIQSALMDMLVGWLTRLAV